MQALLAVGFDYASAADQPAHRCR